jgi:putative membrane-bound dehydrogenase-like protein
MAALRSGLASIVILSCTAVASAVDGNRLAFLDGSDPYYVGRHFARLTTPQWVGEPGVEAVVILAIDDMRGSEKWEAYLRPILERLKRIDGRAPVSIMTCRVEPGDPHLQTWLAEGLSLEIHTLDHPCPLLFGGDFDKAAATYHGCVDLMASVPNNRPVAYRMPCCDSRNTQSPRFFAEIFNRRSPGGNFLSIDSSVFNVLTPNAPQLPRDLVLDDDGRERFRKYLPFPSFVNTIEDYPYPYVIGRLCWEFPCVTPSDWAAQNLHKPNNPRTVKDLQAALDAVVRMQGVYNLVFHPHGWIRPEQIIEIIDHAQRTHGSKVKFLTFKEAQERLNTHLLDGQPLRAADGGDNGVRVADLNHDGFMDVVISNEQVRQTRTWNPDRAAFDTSEFPFPIVTKNGEETQLAGARFGVFHADGRASVVVQTESLSGAWQFAGGKWVSDPSLLAGLERDGRPLLTASNGLDRGLRFVDVDGDGRCEAVLANSSERSLFIRRDAPGAGTGRWQQSRAAIPEGAAIVDDRGRDAGLRFVDVDEDQQLDLVYSNDRHYGLYLWQSFEKGWTVPLAAGKRAGAEPAVLEAGPPEGLPPIVRAGTNNGAWFHSGGLWVQNEDTDKLPDLVDRRDFRSLLADIEPPPRSPTAALRSFHVRAGFEVRLAAAEPLVTDPVAFDWGPDGRLWVVEMGDYPEGADGQGKFAGRVKVLEDTDGDWKYDKSTVFLDGLGYPTGILPWRNGVIVTGAPDVVYAEDTDGDGRADQVAPLLSGFGEGNQQHRVNGPVWGFDNWVYFSNGDSGGTVTSALDGSRVALGGRDFRFNPDTGAIEPLAGLSQFGRAADGLGNWFGCNNANPCFHFALDNRYLNRNPHLLAPSPVVAVPVAPGTASVFPTSRREARFNDFNTQDRFTSACGLHIYRDELFGPTFIGNSFVCEPVHNLVHREVVEPLGTTFTSRRPLDELEREFLASSDSWFRPTMARTGPDGCLWIADMYRRVIEHPEWIPPEHQARFDLRAGADKGRIWRVVPVGRQPRDMPRFDRMNPARLIAQLDSPNGWAADMAQRTILWRSMTRIRSGTGEGSASGGPTFDYKSALRRVVHMGGRPTARLAALGALAGMGDLGWGVLERALADSDPAVRRYAIRLAEGQPEAVRYLLDGALTRLEQDRDPGVRMQLAYSLGEWTDPSAGEALARILLSSRDDPRLRAAAMSSALPHLPALARSAVGAMGSQTPPWPDLIEELTRTAVRAKNEEALTILLDVSKWPASRELSVDSSFAAVLGLSAGLEGTNLSLAEFADGSSDELKRVIHDLTPVWESARAEAFDTAKPLARRLAAVELLGRRGASGAALNELAGLLSAQSPDELQRAAVDALRRSGDDEVGELLLAGWNGYGPALRMDVLSAVLSRPDWSAGLLDALEQGQVAVGDLDAATRQRLLDHRSDVIRSRARDRLNLAIDTDRQAVIENYAARAATGDAARGHGVFMKRCSTCHRMQNEGHSVGPDLAALSDRSPRGLLTAILDPNRAVESRYVNYVGATEDGLVVNGILESEAGGSVTLLAAESKRQQVLRSDLAELSSSGKSLMPEGLEKDVSVEEMADLLAWLSQGAPRPKAFPGNHPAVVRPEALRGELWLLAANGEIFGESAVFEEKFGNVGFWSGESDHVEWTIDLPAPQTFDLTIEYACPPDAAGNTLLVEVSGQRFTATVPATSSWEDYRRLTLGRITLAAGPHRLGVRSAGKISGYLFDLRSVNLRPPR